MPNGSRPAARPRTGFTLLEVMLALAIGGIVLVAARGLVEDVADQADHLARAAAADAERANGERQLRTLVDRLEVGTPGSAAFFGDPVSAQFTTWCDTPAGWLERCTVTLVFSTRGGAPALVVDLPVTGRVVLARGFQRGTFLYLETAAGGGLWVSRWGPGPRAPLALGVVLDADTLILRVGDRG